MTKDENLRSLDAVNPELVELSDRYCEERLSDGDAARLEFLLKDDEQALAFLRRVEIHAGLHWHLRGASEIPLLEAEVESMAVAARKEFASVGLRRWQGIATIATAVSLLFATVLWFSQPKGIVRVANVVGEVLWQRAGSEARPVRIDTELPAGQFESADEESLLCLSYADGTKLEFSGPLSVSIGDTLQKTIFVEKGVLTAHVTPQPPDRPLLVRSPTAEIQVLGTVFTLDAVKEAAHLQVAEGKVRLRRVSDGGDTLVVDRQSVLVTARVEESLQPVILEAPPHEWSLTFDPSREALRGTLLPAEQNGIPRRVAAVAEKFNYADGRSWESYPRIVVQSPLRVGAGFATLAEDTQLEVRWRRPFAKRIGLMIYLRRPEGGSGGHIQGKLEEGSADEQGWQTSRLPLGDVAWVQPSSAPPLSSFQDLRISAIVVTDLQRGQTDLEVSAIRLIRAP